MEAEQTFRIPLWNQSAAGLLICFSAEIRVVALYAGLIAFSLSFDFAGRIAALSGITGGKELHFSLLCYSIVGDTRSEFGMRHVNGTLVAEGLLKGMAARKARGSPS